MLYVDDEDVLREPVKMLLEMDGKVHVDTASSALEGLRAIESGDYDAIISDYQMPEMDGLEFLDRIRSAQLETPFILLTGRGREEVAMEALNRGANFYFQKGGDIKTQIAEILEIVKESAHQRMLQEELREARELMESIVKNTDDAVLLFDIDGTILRVNSSFERIYGWSAEEAVGRKLPMVHDEERADVEARFRAVAETGVADRYQGKRLRKDGTAFYGSMTISPVRDAQGRIICISGIGRDISSYMALLAETERQREWFETTLSSIGDAVITTDKTGNVIYLNPVAQRITGFSLEEASGKPIRDVFRIFNERTRKPVDIPVEKVLKDKMIVGMANHTVLISKDGKAYAISDSAAPIKDRDGHITGTVMVFRDLTSKNVEEGGRLTRIAVTGILGASKSLKEASLPLVETICMGIGCDVGEMWTPGRDGAKLTLMAQWMSPEIKGDEFRISSETMSFSMGEGLPGRVWKEAKPVWVTDIRSDANFVRRKEARTVGLKTTMAFPITTREKIIGVMVFYKIFLTETQDELLGLLADVGKQIGHFYSGHKSEQALKNAMEMMASYMQNSMDATAITDGDGAILEVNPAFETLYGWKSGEIKGGRLPIIPASFEEEHRRKVEEALNGRSTRFEAVRLKKDGTLVEVAISLFPLRDEAGNIYAVGSSTRDVSESKKLRDVLHLHDAVLKTSPYMFIILGNDKESGNRVEFANPSFLEATGLTETDVTGVEFGKVIESIIPQSGINTMLESMSRGSRYSTDSQFRKHSGSNIWVHIDLSPVVSENGVVGHWVCGMRDATEVISSREQLREANEKLRLIADIDRHDIRNSLHSILVSAEAGLLYSGDEAVMKSFRGIKDAARRISDHIEQFKNIRTSIEDEDVRWLDLNNAISHALPGFDIGKVKLTVDVGDTEIHSTPFLEKVFHNLIDNSLRHGESVSRISIVARRHGDSLKVVYADDGHGIPDEMKQSIFAGKLSDRNAHGLYLVRELLESCGMAICETGEYGKGARFEITVPASGFRSSETGQSV